MKKHKNNLNLLKKKVPDEKTGGSGRKNAFGEKLICDIHRKYNRKNVHN